MSETEADAIGLEGGKALPEKRRSMATPNQVLAIVCVGICLANLDLFIVNVGLPNIARDFHNASLEDLSWILNGYAIAYAALLVFFGRLAERHSRNLSFLLGVALFTLASAACAIANSVETLIAFRVAQAAGAALMTPTSIGLLLASFPPERRASAVRTWTAIGGLAAALGPLVGGLLVTLSWRWIFMVNVPIGLIAILIGWLKLPEVPGHDVPRPNPWAALLVTCGIAALTLAIVKANDWGWTSIGLLSCLLAAAVFLAAFTWHCIRSENPFIDPSLFKVKAFTGASLAIAPFTAAFGAMLLSSALWQQTAWGFSALKTGLAIAPGPLMVPLTSLLFAGKLIARFGAAAVTAAGVVFFAAGLVFWTATIGAEPSMFVISAGLVPIGIGVGLTFPTLMGVSAGSLPPSSFATGSAVINMIRQAALAIGVAMFVAIVGTSEALPERIAAFHRGWWIMTAVALVSLLPTYLYIRRR
jgi:EmrB/QacA subfamily drug resistance transporter